MINTSTTNPLTLEQVTLTFHHHGVATTILNNASFCATQGKSYALVGASGSGKSTILQLLGGLRLPQAGTVRYGTTTLTNCSREELLHFRREAIGFVFQQPLLIPECSLIENVALKGLITQEEYDTLQERAHRLLQEVGLEQRAYATPLTLSGGEQHRVSIARALFRRPPFLLLDEPTAHLDQTNKRQILELIERIRCTYPMGMIMATHDQESSQLMDEAWRIHDGTLERER